MNELDMIWNGCVITAIQQRRKKDYVENFDEILIQDKVLDSLWTINQVSHELQDARVFVHKIN